MKEYAINDVSINVLLIHNDVVKGKGRSVGYEFCPKHSKNLYKIELINKESQLTMSKENNKTSVFLLCDPRTGKSVEMFEIFGSRVHKPKSEDCKSILDNLYVVDEDRFYYGIVPDTFKNIKGYKTKSIK